MVSARSRKEKPQDDLRNMLDMVWLNTARRRVGLHAYELAFLCKLTPQKYGMIEMGRVKPTDDELARIKQALAEQETELGKCVQTVVKAARSLSEIQLRQLSDVLKTHYKPSKR